MSPRYVALGVFLSLGSLVRAESAAPLTVDLFAAGDFAGWEVVTAQPTAIRSICTRLGDSVIAITGTPTGYLQTEATYENFSLHLEYRWPAGTAPKANGGILLHIASGPVAPSAWPTCIQLQTKVQNAGDLLQMFGSTFAEPITTPAKGNTPPIRGRQADSSERPFGEWNAVDVVCLCGTIEVRLNGVLQNRVTATSPQAGRLGIQLEGAPFELRNVGISPLFAE